MKKKERITMSAWVFLVQFLDSFLRQPQQRFIFRLGECRRVGKIGEQTEVQIDIAIRQEAHFQGLYQVFRVLWVDKQRGHHH